ncbi:MAG: DUF167 domain-containing protein [Desulfovibrionaceae bacterium]
MERPEYALEDGAGTWRLLVWAQPGAKRTEPVGEYQGCLKIRLAAPAVDNKANGALMAWVAKRLGVKRNRVRLESGQANRRKTLIIDSETEPDWREIAASGT